MKDLEKKAYLFAYKKHGTMPDDCNKKYFNTHILQVVSILKQVTNDENIIAAAYLHDTIEDTHTTKEELLKEFGEDITRLVMEVTHEGKKDHKGYYLPRLKTERGIMLKYADRLSNLSRME